MRKHFALLFVLILATAALAAVGTNYRSSPEGLLAAGGTATGSAYSTQNALGEDITGVTSSSSYSNAVGFIASSVTYATQEAGVPTITDLKFDGYAIVSGDYVNSDVTITALVSDAAASIDTATSSIEIDSDVYTFDNLPGDSTFEVATGLLTYKSVIPFPDGLHTLTITAFNSFQNGYSGTITFRVDSGGLQVINGAVYNYPNPYDPIQGSTEITYRLSADADITIYLFNSLGQRVWKNNFVAGAQGGHAGYNFVLWDGKSDAGEMVGNGIYFVRIVSNGKVIGRGKIAVIK
jgi:hypothetical protein